MSFSEIVNMEGRVNLGRRDKMNFILKLPNLRWVSDIQTEISRTQLDKCVWSSEVRSVIETLNL